MKILKPMLATAVVAMIVASCGTAIKTVSAPPAPIVVKDYVVNIPAKKAALTEEEANNWMHKDLATDTIPGMSTAKAYAFLAGKKSVPVIVGVVDSGSDLSHEDLKDVAWVNEDEIAGNGIDDDKNGYIDDINGWNFLGSVYKENLEYQRMAHDPTLGTPEENAAAKKKQEAEVAKAAQSKMRYEAMLQGVTNADDALAKHFGKKDYTKEEVLKIQTSDDALLQSIAAAKQMYGFGLSSLSQAKEELTKLVTNTTALLNGDYTDYRKPLNDNANDISVTNYGDNKPFPSIKSEAHGTHVSGIIGASRNNGIGMDGIANNVRMMAVRTVPDGDEYDKDVALGIRYAVDNGAKVINTSFGKGFSPQRQWVWDAIKYAAKHDVLIVNAAGNSSLNIDVDKTFPMDSKDLLTEISDNFITIGAMSSSYDEHLPATFTNYGKINVDVFAPGVKIYSTTPENEYKKFSGTSMASPATAGVAAMIRSYYPKLTASQVKHILMDSGTKINFDVIKPGTKDEKVPFADLSVSGKVVNAYQAVQMAARMSK